MRSSDNLSMHTSIRLCICKGVCAHFQVRARLNKQSPVASMVPLLLKRTTFTGPLCSVRVLKRGGEALISVSASRAQARLQILALPSEPPVANRLPPAWTCTEKMGCPAQWMTGRHDQGHTTMRNITDLGEQYIDQNVAPSWLHQGSLSTSIARPATWRLRQLPAPWYQSMSPATDATDPISGYRM